MKIAQIPPEFIFIYVYLYIELFELIWNLSRRIHGDINTIMMTYIYSYIVYISFHNFSRWSGFAKAYAFLGIWFSMCHGFSENLCVCVYAHIWHVLPRCTRHILLHDDLIWTDCIVCYFSMGSWGSKFATCLYLLVKA